MPNAIRTLPVEIPSKSARRALERKLMNVGMIPLTLKDRDQWVLWKTVSRGEQMTKVPSQANGEAASSTNAETWTTFDAAVKAYEAGGDKFSGVGFVFSHDDELCGIDLDGCRDLETGTVAEWAKTWIVAFDSYAEVSPSGTGVKIFVFATKPTWCGCKVSVSAEAVAGDKKPGIEIYDRGRYFAVTGQRLKEMPSEPQERQSVVDQFCEAFFARPAVAPVHETRDFGSEDAIIDRARKYISVMEPAVSGSSGHNRTFSVACVLMKGFGLTKEQGISLLREWNSTHCTPPWSEKELQHKINSAAKASGETNYLRLARQHDWKNIRLPVYEAQKTKPSRKFVTGSQSTAAYNARLESGAEDLLQIGIKTIDHAIGGGVGRGETIVFAAPSNHCKSSFALQMIHHCSLHRLPCLIISSEMSHHLLGKRTLQTYLDISEHEYKNNLPALHTARNCYHELREEWYVDDEARTIDEVLQSIDEACDQFKIQVVALDYLQMIEATAGKSQYEKVSMVSGMLRDKAKERNVTLLALCQMNREIEKRNKYQPKLSDIKDSSKIVQDADVVIFGIWPHKVDESKPADKYDIYIAKNRNRDTRKSILQVSWDAARQTFYEATTVQKYDFT